MSTVSYDGSANDIVLGTYGGAGFGMYMLIDETRMYVGETNTSEIFQWNCT